MTTRSWLLAAGLIGLALALFIPFLFGGQVLTGQDLARVYTPIAALLRDCLRGGDFSRLAWNPDLGAGFPLIADGATTAFYLPHWPLVVAFLPARALTAAVLLAYGGSALAMAAFAISLGHSRTAAFVAGTAYAWSGLAVGHAVHVNVVAGLPFLPLVLLGVERSARRPDSWRPAVLAGVALGVQCLGGHPQIVFMTGATAGAYAVFRFSSRSQGPGFGRAARTLAVVLAIGAGLSAAYYLPMAELASQSVQPGTGFAQRPAVTYSLPPAHLATALQPFFFYDEDAQYRGAWNPVEMAFYPGVVVLLLAAAAIVLKRDARPVRFFAVLAAVGLLFALGDATPVHWLLEVLPVVRNLRAPARYMLLTCVGASLLAAAGLDALREGTAHARRRVAFGALALLVISVAFANLGPEAFGPQVGDGWRDAQPGVVSALWPARRWLPPVWLALAAVALLVKGSPRQFAAAVLASLVLVDQATFATIALGPQWAAPSSASGDATRRPSPSEARRYVVNSPEPWRSASDRALVDGYRGLDIYVSLPLRRHSDYLRAFWLSDQAAPALLQAAAVGTVADAWRRPLDPRVRFDDDEWSPRWPIATASPGTRIRFDLPGTRADSVSLVTFLEDAGSLPQGTVAATVRLEATDQSIHSFDLRAGIETAERGATAASAHSPAARGVTGWSRLDGLWDGRFAHARHTWPRELRLTSLEIEYRAAEGRLRLFGGVLRSAHTATSLSPFMAAPYVRRGDEDGAAVYGLEGSRPRAAAVHRIVRVASPADAVGRLAAPDAAIDAIGLEDPAAPEPAGDGPSLVTLLVDEPLRVELRAEMGGSGYVVLADTYYPGWETEVDGVRAPVYAADGLFRAVIVPGGTHQVTFRYVSWPLRLGVGVSLVTLAAAAVLIARDRRRRYS